MPPTSLGKRTRKAPDEDFVPETPRKRTRQSTAASTASKENQDPLADLDDSCPPTKPSPHRRATTSAIPPVTPQTPRFRDALASPSTPRHVVMSVGKLFRRATPQTPLSPSSAPTIYHSARQLFARGGEPGQLVGREDEREQLESFIGRLGSTNPNGCLYVSGPPGTGKSAMVQETTKKGAGQPGVQYTYINCMSIKSSKDLYLTLLEGLSSDGSRATEADAMATLQNIFLPKTKKKSAPAYLVVLDEIDHILTMGLESLYRMFEWSLQKSSRLALIGIANALDLTDRFLPRLKAKNMKPDLLPFLPYTAPQIKNVILTRLKTLMPATTEQSSYVPFIHPAAVELCSRKIATQTGDLRKAFEVCRRALDLIESETKSGFELEAREQMLLATPSRKPLGETVNGSSVPSRQRNVAQLVANSFESLTAETAPRATISHLNRVTSAAFSNGTNQRLKTLNLQQKAALCALVAFEKRNRAGLAAACPPTPSKTKTLAPTVKMLFDTYCRLCKTEALLHPLSSSEFREVVGSLETLGLITPVDGKTGALVMKQTPSKRGRWVGSADDKRVASCVSENEVEQATDGLGGDILKSILSGDVLD
ncbi:related to cell division control protein CDC18+ [Cephalotrichum gorgonifer]|uniref:Cell division control protein n=1 Tax=Cephalotrichum gorgonifer TaxID=2041049 RepID=A0AAE8MNK5_9PEZI|nr:related to cell division control protein CDC18+ [Cephalotrichum gorgonifer]